VPGECEEGKCKVNLCYSLLNEYVCSGTDYSCCEPSDCCEPGETCNSNGSISRCCPQNEGICWGKGEAAAISWCCLDGWECCGRLNPFGRGICCPPNSNCCTTSPSGCCGE
jgi:hypothetical protein